MWKKVNFEKFTDDTTLEFVGLTVDETLVVIEFYMSYGFEFKVENHALFWR